MRSCILNLPVKVLFFPSGENLRFPVGEIRLHRELGPRQIQGLFVVHAKNTEISIKLDDGNEGGRSQEPSSEFYGELHCRVFTGVPQQKLAASAVIEPAPYFQWVEPVELDEFNPRRGSG